MSTQSSLLNYSPPVGRATRTVELCLQFYLNYTPVTCHDCDKIFPPTSCPTSFVDPATVAVCDTVVPLG